MNVSEWSLIIFTVLGQMSVGAFIILGVLHFYALRKAGAEEADRLSDRALIAIFIVMLLGFLASVLHLGNPLNAPKSVSNFATSWLSREILLGVVFAVFAGLFTILQWRKVGSFAFRNVIAIITAVIGIGLVASMSMVYMIETQPGWNTFATPLSFFTTALLLGAVSLGAALVANYAIVKRKNPDCEDVQCELMKGALRWISILAIIALGIEFIFIPLYLSRLASIGNEAAATASLMIDDYGVVFGLRLLLAFVGAGVLGMFIYQNSQNPESEKALANFAYTSFVLVFAAELLGRFLFYATQVQIGI
jgi:anaerobic dimethyl sulfoxide reductase subunit C (anchor subunit)